MSWKSIAVHLSIFTMLSIGAVIPLYANDKLAGLGGVFDKIKKQAEDTVKKTVEEAISSTTPQQTGSQKDQPTSSTQDVNLKTLPVGDSATPNQRYRYVSLFDSRSSENKPAATPQDPVSAINKKSRECRIVTGYPLTQCLTVNNKGSIAIYNQGNSEFLINDGKQVKVVSVSQVPTGQDFAFKTIEHSRGHGVFNDAGQIAYLTYIDGGSSRPVIDGIGFFDGIALKKLDFQGKLNVERIYEIALNNKGLITLSATRSATPSQPLVHDFTDVYTVNSQGEIKNKVSTEKKRTFSELGIKKCPSEGDNNWLMTDNGTIYVAARKEIYYCKGATKQVIAKEDESQNFLFMDTQSISPSGAVAYKVHHNNRNEIYFWNGDASRLIADVHGPYESFTHIISASKSGVLFDATLKKAKDSKNYISDKGLFVGPDALNDRIVVTGDRLLDGMVAGYTPLRLTDTGQVVFIVSLVTPEPRNRKSWVQIVRADPL